jgi:hypothetical protein
LEPSGKLPTEMRIEWRQVLAARRATMFYLDLSSDCGFSHTTSGAMKRQSFWPYTNIVWRTPETRRALCAKTTNPAAM